MPRSAGCSELTGGQLSRPWRDRSLAIESEDDTGAECVRLRWVRPSMAVDHRRAPRSYRVPRKPRDPSAGLYRSRGAAFREALPLEERWVSCAPGALPIRTLAISPKGRFPSGQRGQTVNLMAQPSQVRILLSPPPPISGRDARPPSTRAGWRLVQCWFRTLLLQRVAAPARCCFSRARA